MKVREVGKGKFSQKVSKEGAVCGLVESKESKSMLVLFLHSSNRKKTGSKPEAKQEKYYIQETKQKTSTFSSFQRHREFALKSKMPVPLKATPEGKAIVTKKQNNNCTKATVETAHPQPKKKEIHFPYVTISAAPRIQVDYFQLRAH